jgi:hypothetical protein
MHSKHSTFWDLRNLGGTLKWLYLISLIVGVVIQIGSLLMRFYGLPHLTLLGFRFSADVISAVSMIFILMGIGVKFYGLTRTEMRPAPRKSA